MKKIELTWKEMYPSYEEWVFDLNDQIHPDEAVNYITEIRLKEFYENEVDPMDVRDRIFESNG